MDAVLVQQVGRDLYVRPTTPAGLPDALVLAVAAELTYTERLYDPAGGYLWEHRPLYRHTSDGGLHCLAGLRVRLLRLLRQQGVPHQFLPDSYYASDVFAPDFAAVARAITLRGWQAEALPYFVAATGGGVEATTGAGKGPFMAALCLAHPKATIHVVSKARDVVQNTYDELVKFMGPVVGRWWGGCHKPARVTVATVDSLDRLGYDNVDICVLEEAHELCGPSHVARLAKYRRAKMFWVTGSFERDDGRHREIEALCGPALYELPHTAAEAAGDVVPVVVRWVRPHLDYDPAEGVPPGVDRERLGVWRNEPRNRTLAAAARRFGQDDQALVMAKTVEHVCFLSQQLPDYALCYAESRDAEDKVAAYEAAGIVPAERLKVTPARRRQLRADFGDGTLKKVISNYVWSTGVNFRRLAVLVRADAGGSSTKDTQITGRVCRTWEEGGKTHGTVVDVWDDWSRPFLDRARRRRKHYEERGYKQFGPFGEPW